MATQNERAVIDLVINGKQAEATTKELTKAYLEQRKVLYSMAEADPGYAKQKKLVEDLMRTQQARIVKLNEEKSAWQKFATSTTSIMAGFVGGDLISTAIGKIGSAITTGIDKYKAFNAASQELSAVTGASGKDLEYLNQQAAKIGPTVGKSGAEMLEAYKLMASAKPELLANKELLVETTKAAITLAQAGKIDLATATQVTAESLNQFGESADQANRYINVVAAGATAGAAEINEMGAALKNSGTVAAAQGVSFEQTNAVLQSLSVIALKGGEAGTQLRNVLLTLGSGSDETNPRIVGLDKALENLAKKNLSTAEMTKLFGKENLIAAQHIIGHRAEITELTKQVTGTSEAYTQAEKNNASLDHQLEIFWAKVDGIAVSIGEALVPAFTQLISKATNLLGILPNTLQWLNANKEAFALLGLATVAYYGNLIKATAAAVANTTAELARKVAYEAGYRWLIISELATKAYALATGVLTGQISLQTAAVTVGRNAWAALNAIMRANPIGVVVTAVAALAYAVKLYSDNTERAIQVEREKVRLQRDMQTLTEKHTGLLTKFNEQMQNYANLSQAERAELVKNIALSRLDVETQLVRMRARAKHAELLAAEPSLWQQLWIAIKSGGDPSKMAQDVTQQVADNMMAIRQQFAAGIDGLQNELKQYDSMIAQAGQYGASAKPATGGGGSGPTEEQKKAAKKRQDQAKQDAKDLETMLAESRKRVAGGVESDYEREVAAFAEKYSKMYELAKNNEAKINEIRTLSLLEWADIEKKHTEKLDEEARKETEKENKVGFDAAMKANESTRTDALTSADQNQFNNPTKVGEAETMMKKLEAEEAYLTQKLLLEQTFAQESAETQRQLTENQNNQSRLRAETERAYALKIKQAEWELQDAKKQAMQQGLGVLLGFLDKNTVAYKAALIAQKAFAIAQVIVDMNREIAQYGANPTWSLLPDGGLALKTASIAAARVRAGIGIATIAGTTIGELAAKADGGYTGRAELYGGSGGPSGFTNGPTVFGLGSRSYLAGEAGREWIMSAPMLQNPVMANLAGALQALQVSGQYKNLGYSDLGLGGSSSGAADLLSAIHQQLMLSNNQLLENNAKMEQIAQRPINYNSFKIRESQELTDEINVETSL